MERENSIGMVSKSTSYRLSFTNFTSDVSITYLALNRIKVLINLKEDILMLLLKVANLIVYDLQTLYTFTKLKENFKTTTV